MHIRDSLNELSSLLAAVVFVNPRHGLVTPVIDFSCTIVTHNYNQLSVVNATAKGFLIGSSHSSLPSFAEPLMFAHPTPAAGATPTSTLQVSLTAWCWSSH